MALSLEWIDTSVKTKIKRMLSTSIYTEFSTSSDIWSQFGMLLNWGSIVEYFIHSYNKQKLPWLIQKGDKDPFGIASGSVKIFQIKQLLLWQLLVNYSLIHSFTHPHTHVTMESVSYLAKPCGSSPRPYSGYRYGLLPYRAKDSL